MAHISTKELIRELRAQGWEVEQTTQGHYRAAPPDRSKPLVHMGGDSGDYRAMKNKISQLKKSGFVPPWDELSDDEDSMTNGTNDREPHPTMTLDYLEHVLELYAHVHGVPADQVLFTREAAGRWLMTIPNDRLVAEGDHGKGVLPYDACQSLFREMRETIRKRIHELQKLDARLGP